MLMSKNHAPAKLQYLPYSFRVMSAGDYVICAETGVQILLDDLRYWSIERQEPYVDAAASTRAEMKARAAKGLPL